MKMRFSMISVLAVALCAAESLAAPASTPISESPEAQALSALDKRAGNQVAAKCNGTSCKYHWFGIPINLRCRTGSCVGKHGGDGTPCTVVVEALGAAKAYCPAK